MATTEDPIDLEAEMDGLYALELAGFTAARNALARRLRAAGRKAEALAAQALEKPSQPAWVINQLARREPEAMAELFAAGDRLRQAQVDALSPGASAGFRSATQAEREAVAGLRRRASALLAAGGSRSGEDLLNRVASSLHALAADPSGRRLVGGGRLTREVEPPGFEALAGMALAPAVAAVAEPAPAVPGAPAGKTRTAAPARVDEAAPAVPGVDRKPVVRDIREGREKHEQREQREKEQREKEQREAEEREKERREQELEALRAARDVARLQLQRAEKDALVKREKAVQSGRRAEALEDEALAARRRADAALREQSEASETAEAARREAAEARVRLAAAEEALAAEAGSPAPRPPRRRG